MPGLQTTGGRWSGWVVVTGWQKWTDFPVHRTNGFFKADKTTADIRAIIIDGTSSLGKKLAAVFDNQLMTTNE